MTYSRALNWIGYQFAIHGPWRFTCDPRTRFGAWCLSRAGGHVYGENIGGRDK